MASEAPPLLPHQTPEYIAQDKGPMIVAVTVTVAVISTMFVAARIFTRQKIMGKMHLDDWLVIVSIVFEWACVALALTAVKHGNGRHFDLLELENMQGVIFWTILGFPFGIVAFGVPKLAVVALLCRIMNPSKKHRIFLWSMTTFCLVILSGCIVILFAQCTPAKSQWTFSITEKTCWDPYVLIYYAIVAGGMSALVDLYLAVYPAIVLWHLQMNIRKKLALCVALGIGSIATVVAIYKCTRLPSLASPDFSYDTSDLVIWTAVEAATIIVACCIPVLQPLVDLVFGRRTLASSNGYRNYGSSRSGALKSDIEMEKGPNGRSGGRSQVSKNTISSRSDTIAIDSQESILREQDIGGRVPEPAPAPRALARQPSRVNSTGIVRTDMVTVTYDNSDVDEQGRPADAAQKSWIRM